MGCGASSVAVSNRSNDVPKELQQRVRNSASARNSSRIMVKEKTSSQQNLSPNGRNGSRDTKSLESQSVQSLRKKPSKRVSISNMLPTYKNGVINTTEDPPIVRSSSQDGHITPRKLDPDEEHPSETDAQSTESNSSVADPSDIPVISEPDPPLPTIEEEKPKEEPPDQYVADMYIPNTRKASVGDDPTKLKIGEKISVMSSTGRKLSYGSITFVGKGRSRVLINGRNREEWQQNEAITKICPFCDLPIPYKMLDEKGDHVGCFYATPQGQFLRAARLGDIEKCSKIINSNPETLKTTDPDGNTALHNAAANNQIRFMEHLITEKDGLSLLETPNKHGLTPLLSASIWANAVNYLLDQGADTLVHTDVGDTLLHLSAKFGCLTVLQVALERGIPINSQNKLLQTALHYASDNGHTDCVKHLLEQGANPNLEDKMKRKPLDVAYDYADITKLLCDAMGIPVIQMEKHV